MSKQQKNTDNNFESSMAELEQLVIKMESGELTLDDSLAQFQRGVELTRHCQQLLENARLTVEKLSDPEDSDSTEPFTQE